MSESDGPRWLRNELARHLAAVRAPDALWDRILNPSEPRSVAATRWARWPVAALVALATAAGTYWVPAKPLAPQSTQESLVQPDLRSDHPAGWDLRCVLPANRSVFRVASLPERRGHPFAAVVSGSEFETTDCQLCHSTGAAQHHL